MKNKILLIDDEVEILNVYEKILNQEENLSEESLDFLDSDFSLDTDENFLSLEYETITATSGEEGVEKAIINPDVKVAFIDMRMPPGMNGAQTAKKIRDINPKIEIVIVTAYSDINLHEIVEIIGKPEKILYLRKPFASEEIEQMALNLVTKYNNARIKDRFLGNVSHEMKTPLSIISGYAQVLQEVIEDKENQEFVRNIVDGAKQLDELIDGLLFMTEINNSSEIGNTSESWINISEVVEDIQKITYILRSRYPEIQFFSDISCGDRKVSASKRKLVYAISNILDNAFKFTKKGNVNFSVSYSNESLLIEIVDSGEGIVKDKLKYVFDKFYRVEDAIHTEVGFGLGLSNSKEIIEDLKGSIEVESKVEEGTKVKILLPA